MILNTWKPELATCSLPRPSTSARLRWILAVTRSSCLCCVHHSTILHVVNVEKLFPSFHLQAILPVASRPLRAAKRRLRPWKIGECKLRLLQQLVTAVFVAKEATHPQWPEPRFERRRVFVLSLTQALPSKCEDVVLVTRQRLSLRRRAGLPFLLSLLLLLFWMDDERIPVGPVVGCIVAILTAEQ